MLRSSWLATTPTSDAISSGDAPRRSRRRRITSIWTRSRALASQRDAVHLPDGLDADLADQLKAKQQAIALVEHQQRVRHRALELGAVTPLGERHLGRHDAAQGRLHRRPLARALLGRVRPQQVREQPLRRHRRPAVERTLPGVGGDLGGDIDGADEQPVEHPLSRLRAQVGRLHRRRERGRQARAAALLEARRRAGGPRRAGAGEVEILDVQRLQRRIGARGRRASRQLADESEPIEREVWMCGPPARQQGAEARLQLGI
jgi:hypothetical protein